MMVVQYLNKVVETVEDLHFHRFYYSTTPGEDPRYYRVIFFQVNVFFEDLLARLT